MKRRNVVVLIIMLAVGFAAVSATLVINGVVKLAFNEKDFDVYFSDATLNGEKKSEFISSDGKTLDFTTNVLNVVGDQATVYYEITNASREYDAQVKLTCDEFNNEYVSFTNVLNAEVIKAGEKEDGVLVAELMNATVEDKEVRLTCQIEATPIERDSVVEDSPNEGEITTYSLYGYFVNKDGEIIPNADLVIYSGTPHYVRTDSRGYFYVEGLERGSHEIYYLNESSDISNMTKEQIKEASITSSIFTTSSAKIDFKNEFSIKDMVIELTNNNNSFNVKLMTSSGVLISDKYSVTQNKPYGSLPKVEVINSSFIEWRLENGEVIDEDTLVAKSDTHILIAVISPVVAPVLRGGSDSWQTNNVTISIERAGVAEKGIKEYEYLITNTLNPDSEVVPTGSTVGNVTIQNSGVNYVYFRTVANDGIKSSWSSPQTVKIDKSAPTNVGFSNKSVTSSLVTLNVDAIENESGISNIKCLYGDANNQSSLGTSKNEKCEYPSTAEYAKVCVTNGAGKETCSATKKLAEYFIKNGVPQVEFLHTVNATVSQESDHYRLAFLDGSEDLGGRGEIYTKNKYDFRNYNYVYVDIAYSMSVFGKCNPTMEINVLDSPFYTFNDSTGKRSTPLIYGFSTKDPGFSSSSERKVVSSKFSRSINDNDLLSIGKNSSSQYIESKIYNIWFQLSN